MVCAEYRIVLAAITVFVSLTGFLAAIHGLLFDQSGVVRYGAAAVAGRREYRVFAQTSCYAERRCVTERVARSANGQQGDGNEPERASLGKSGRGRSARAAARSRQRAHQTRMSRSKSRIRICLPCV